MMQQQQHQGPLPAARTTADGEALADNLGTRHGFSPSAVSAVLRALELGGGQQAQFDHPELGGMGQWSRGGMLMIGDVFNSALKARVGALFDDAASQPTSRPLFAEAVSASRARWPAELGRPAATGSQNDIHYAVFPDTRRLAIDFGGRIAVYDTADHVISGFSQQQSGAGTATFHSQHGAVALDQLQVISPAAESGAAAIADTPTQKTDRAPAADPVPTAHVAQLAPSPAVAAVEAHSAILAKIEGLAGLHAKGILSDAEYAAKKTQLLDRL